MNTTEIIRIDGLPPSSNHGYKATGRGGKTRMYKTADVKAWQDMVMWEVQAQRIQPHQDWTGKEVSFKLTVADPNRSVDLSNAVKYTEDAVVKVLGYNDKFHDYISVLRLRSPGSEGIIIYVGEM